MQSQLLNINIFRSVFFILLLSLFTQTSAFAGSTTLDALFLNLKNSANESDAKAIESKIWDSWMTSGNVDVDVLLQDALRKRRGYDFNGSIAVLNEIIEIKPDFSEAWNQRATVYFMQGKYEESLIDIAKTLELEPRHFGSLAGRAVIRMRQSKPALAQQNIIEALKVHPYLRERRMFPNLKKT